MNINKITDGLTYLSQNKRINLIHGVLSRLHISPLNDNYDDYFQDGCLIFADAFANYPDDPHNPENERRLMNFAYKRIYWRLLDHFRIEAKLTEHQGESLNNDMLDEDKINRLLLDPQSTINFARLEDHDFFNQLKERCTQKERLYLEAVLYENLTDSEIAKKYHVSRQTVYAWKKGIRKKVAKSKII
ncbi:sigma-70 family RNA polymerase sigma factor [Lactobacillaceae bacterium 24-114]